MTREWKHGARTLHNRFLPAPTDEKGHGAPCQKDRARRLTNERSQSTKHFQPPNIAARNLRITVVRPEDDHDARSVGDATVVIVDKHAILAEALRFRLDQEPGLRVMATTNTTADLTDLVARHNPDVVIIDVVIGEVDGIDLIPMVRHEGKGPAVLVLISDQSHRTAREAVRRGASAVVLKTAPISDLIVAIGTAARGEAWVSPSLLSGLLASLELAPEPRPDRALLNGLSPRELEVLSLLVEGFGYATISKKLGLSVNTVRTHAHNVNSKLGVHSRVAAVAVALRAGLRPAGT